MDRKTKANTRNRYFSINGRINRNLFFDEIRIANFESSCKYEGSEKRKTIKSRQYEIYVKKGS